MRTRWRRCARQSDSISCALRPESLSQWMFCDITTHDLNNVTFALTIAAAGGDPQPRP